MTDFVLDNLVTMRWGFDGGNHVYADAILQRPETDSDATVLPVLWRYEMSAVLSRTQIKGWVTPGKAAEFLEDIAALNIMVDAESAARVRRKLRGSLVTIVAPARRDRVA